VSGLLFILHIFQAELQMIKLNPKIPKHGHSGFRYIPARKIHKNLGCQFFVTWQTDQIEILPNCALDSEEFKLNRFFNSKTGKEIIC